MLPFILAFAALIITVLWNLWLRDKDW